MNAMEHDSSFAQSLLYLNGVSVSFDGFRAINNLSLTLAPGEMRAVIGPNGAGKTTMMDIITGKTRPDAGQVIFGSNTDLTKLDEPAIAALGIGRKFQKPTVFEVHDVWENLLLALAGDRRPRFSLWARELRSATGSNKSCSPPVLANCAIVAPAICRTAKSSGWKSACCSRRSRSCCWSMSPSPA